MHRGNRKDEKHINTLSELGNLPGNWQDKTQNCESMKI